MHGKGSTSQTEVEAALSQFGQLIDAAAGTHLWAERFEGSLMPTPYERDETLVRLQSQQRRATVKAGGAGVLEG